MYRRSRHRCSWSQAIAAALLVAMPVGAEPPKNEIEPARGWRYEVFAVDLPQVDNLAVDVDDTIFATLERSRGRGAVVRIVRGGHETVLGELNRADGLLLHGKRLIVTEEVPDGRIIEIDLVRKTHRVLATVDKGEGLGVLSNGDLVITEDTVQGRLLRLRKNGSIEVLLSGLTRPEGIAVAADDSVFIAETSTGRVLHFNNGQLNTVVDDLNEPDQIRFAPDGALWITEDANPGQVLRLKNGGLEVIASALSYPQGIAFLRDGSALIAEQGRNRILRIFSEPVSVPRYPPR